MNCLAQVTLLAALTFGVDSKDAATALTPVPISAGTATLGPENTRIQFVGTHVGAKPDPRTGVFGKFTGKAEIDPAKHSLKAVSFEIKTESLETPIAKLTTHLKSPDFFDVRQYPTAKFQSTSVVPGDSDGKYVVTGNLTLLKATKEVKIPVTVSNNDKGLTLTADFKIDRTQFGMSGFQDQVNKEVAMTVEIGRGK